MDQNEAARLFNVMLNHETRLRNIPVDRGVAKPDTVSGTECKMESEERLPVSGARRVGKFYSEFATVPLHIQNSIVRAGVIMYHKPVSSVPKSMSNVIDDVIEDFDDLDACNLWRSPSLGETVAANCDDVWVALAIDNKHDELTDCGGQRSRSESVVQTASRELYEESSRIFRADPRILETSPVVCDGATCIFFVNASRTGAAVGFPDLLCLNFNSARSVCEKYKNRAYLENSKMLWMPLSAFVAVCVNRRFKKRDPIQIPKWMKSTIETVESEVYPNVFSVSGRLIASAVKTQNPKSFLV